MISLYNLGSFEFNRTQRSDIIRVKKLHKMFQDIENGGKMKDTDGVKIHPKEARGYSN